jgi:signal transduction histidine kinase
LESDDKAATVLIVEDDDATAELMARELARNGTITVITQKVADALALLRKQSFSAILLDYQLPDGDPWAVVEAGASVRAGIPVILVTGHGSESIASDAIRRGVAGYVIKSGPFWEQLPAILGRVTKLAAEKERQRDGNAQIDCFAAISHEIRTPLNALIGLGYLLERTPLSEDQRKLIKHMQTAGTTLLSVVNDVLDLSKIDAGAMTLESEVLDIAGLLSNVLQLLEPLAKTKGIELIVVPSVEPPGVVKGDASRLRQILINLVNNAIKFTQVGRVAIKVAWARQGFERVSMRCEVKDTGIGMKPDVLERLFKPYSQADSTISGRFGGTGLGLSISRRLVRLMGGEMGVSSTEGVGSTFWFEVPLQSAAP